VICLPTIGYSFRWLVIAVSIMLWSGCSLRMPLQTQFVSDLGRIEFRKPAFQLSGVVVGVPHGMAEPSAVAYATAISNGTGAGLVIAYGFGANRIAVSRPLVHRFTLTSDGDKLRRPGSFYREFKDVLRNAAAGPLEVYLGSRFADQASDVHHIEVTAAGFTFEQIQSLKETFLKIRDRALTGNEVPTVEMAVDPLERISWRATGVKHHGVLMVAEKGLNVHLPKVLTSSKAKAVYSVILTTWFRAVLATARQNPARLPEVKVTVLRYGRIDSISARSHLPSVVIGAPHGSFDEYTDALVKEISHRTGIAAVVTKGFTPTECGGWRINVNRPTETRYPTGDIERETERAKDVYARFENTVLAAARGPLNLYVDVHQNMDQDNIDVATLEVSSSQAQTIKAAYREIRGRVLNSFPDIERVSLLIEPIDQVGIGAWAAKDRGILRLAKQSLHFELPAHRVLHNERARQAYTTILTELIDHLTHARQWEVPTGVSTTTFNSIAKKILRPSTDR
jgi:hypothetical protein